MLIAICDDEKRIGGLIEKYIWEYKEETEDNLEIEVFSSGEELVEFMRNGNQVDLLFLDIVFSKGLDGIAISDIIRNELDDQRLKLVYVSGSQSHDRKLFSYQPMNFIAKPIRKECLYEEIERARKLLELNETLFVYQKGHDTERIKYGDILYFESMGRKLIIHTRDGLREFYGRLNDIEEKAEKHHFMRIHRSYLVNYTYVTRIGRKEVEMKDKAILNIGETYIKKVQMDMLRLEMGD